MERNTIIGFVLILAMLTTFQYFQSQTVVPPQKTTQTSTKPTSVRPSVPVVTPATVASPAKEVVLENTDLKIVLNSLSGSIQSVSLKNYSTFEKKPLLLGLNPKGILRLDANGFSTGSQNFEVTQQTTNKVVFKWANASGQAVEQTYTLGAKGFTLDYNLKTQKLSGDAQLVWEQNVAQTEKDLSKFRTESTVNYLLTDDSFDNLSQNGSATEETVLEVPAKWLTFKQMYFVSGLIPKGFTLPNPKLKSVPYPEENNGIVKTLMASTTLSGAALANANFTLYFGPNDIHTLEKITPDFDQNVYLGYAFVKPINRYIFVPLFEFLGSFISNYGWLIVVLVLIIKLVLTPLTYKSYISMAKMRVLQPELTALKEKIGDDDPTKMQQAQMNLYQQVGVNPMSGCVPQLLTLPILMSVFFLFPNLIELRQQPFWWAEDLSTYDNIINFGTTSIPLLGSHISIFTVLMTASSILFAWYNNQTTPATSGPVDMKMLGYIMPLVFFFVMNSFPAGLAWYYLVSNLVTIGQQQIIKRFVDEDQIKAALEENRKKIASGEKKKSKFSEMLDKQLKAAEEMKKQAEVQNKKKK